jgi:hypothetical protein
MSVHGQANQTNDLSECQHRWVRCPDRDSLKGGSIDRHGLALQGYTETVLVFYCEKCLRVETRQVTVDTESTA